MYGLQRTATSTKTKKTPGIDINLACVMYLLSRNVYKRCSIATLLYDITIQHDLYSANNESEVNICKHNIIIHLTNRNTFYNFSH